MKKILLAIAITIIFIYVVPFYMSPENYSEENLFYAHGMGVLFVSTIMFLVYVVVGIPVTLVVDLIESKINSQRILYTYLIQLFLYSIVTVCIGVRLFLFVFVYFHLLFLLRLPSGKASLTLLDIFGKKCKVD
ncbi:hypothetical protein [Bacillus sp. AFS053548]|uniref:hypothetical protein n=1 Tax=Bacillus sp. AFS053548 TaxID=2033505 RepID=UPI000BFE705A|nr:hypothetical protein [Bacillus sp. AFS053548]PGM57411.1 hypothetical protein CN946_07630 [Bacillus sp. AFS053548]